MRLKYIFHRQNKSIHPFYVKSNWEPPVQPSVTLEHYLGRGQTLTKIHKPTLVGRPIISGCNGPTERISAFVDTKLLQPISTSQTSYLKDSTDFINFIEKTKMGKRTFLVTMDVTSLYTNIPQEGITSVCNAYENFHKNNPPIPTNYIKEMLRRILKENSFQFNGTENYLQIHGTAMGTKWPLLSQISLWPT